MSKKESNTQQINFKRVFATLSILGSLIANLFFLDYLRVSHYNPSTLSDTFALYAVVATVFFLLLAGVLQVCEMVKKKR